MNLMPILFCYISQVIELCVPSRFFLLRLICISVSLPFGHAQNTVVMYGLVLLIATWNCWISYKNGYVGLLVLHSVTASLELLAHCQYVASWSLFLRSINLVDIHLNQLNWFHFLIFKGGLLVILMDSLIFLLPLFDVTRMSMSTVSFLAQLDSGIFCL